jgi:hypothetical protein
MLAASACGGRPAGEAETGFSQVVVVTPTGMDGTGRAVPGGLGSNDPIPLTIEVQNRSGGEITIQDIQALVLDPAGTIHGRTTLAGGRRLANGLNDTYRGSVGGPRPETSVLGVRTWIRDAKDRPRASTECRPLCRTCDPDATRQACEQFDRLGLEGR